MATEPLATPLRALSAPRNPFLGGVGGRTLQLWNGLGSRSGGICFPCMKSVRNCFPPSGPSSAARRSV
jgi:hypothetical protein